MPKIRVNDINLYYEIYGEGFPLLMILGLEANILWWGKSLLQQISKNYRVIVFDNRGTGRSDAPDKDFTLYTLVEDTIGLMNALNIKYTHIFGHSMGGRIAQGLVLNYPENIAKLCLCSTSCGASKLIPASPEIIRIINTPREDMTPKQAAKNMLSIFYTPAFLKNHPKFVDLAVQNIIKVQTSQKNYNRQIKAIESFDICEKLKNIKNQTLIMHGIKDNLVPVQNGEILAELIPEAKFISFKNSAHVPYVEERDKFIKILMDFLK